MRNGQQRGKEAPAPNCCVTVGCFADLTVPQFLQPGLPWLTLATQAVSGVRETLETNIRLSNGIPSTGEAPTSAPFSQLAGSRGRRVGRRDDGVGERLKTELRGDTPSQPSVRILATK